MDSNGFYPIMSNIISSCFTNCVPFIRSIKNKILEPIHDLCKVAFADYPIFINYIRSELDSAIEKQVEKAKAFIKELSELDYTVFTLNPLYLSIVKNLSTHCSNVIKQIKNSSNTNFNVNQVTLFSSNIQNSHSNLTPEVFNLSDIIQIDSEMALKSMKVFKHKNKYDLELTMLLSMYAYWVVFFRRFNDYLMLCNQKYLYHYFKNNFKNILQRLSPGLNEKSQGWIEDNPLIELKRHNLGNRIAILEKSYDTLNNLF